MKNLESFELFEKYRGKLWFDNLLHGLEKLKSNPSYWNEKKKDEYSINLSDRDRIVENIKKIFYGYTDIKYLDKKYISFPIWIKYSKSKSLNFEIRELEDEYFRVKVYLHQYRSYKTSPVYYYICDQESGLYSLLREIEKLVDAP